MSSPLTFGTAAMLTAAPLLWAGNAIVGRLVHDLISPFTLNLMRWGLALLVLLPLAGHVLRKNSAIWQCWKQYALLGVLGIGSYNALLYLALKTSSPINVTLVGSSMPIWMLLIGRFVFGSTISGRQAVGAVLSMLGVALVLSRGSPQQLLSLQLVPGDWFILMAAIVWSLYSWLLARSAQTMPSQAQVRSNWAAFLIAQLIFGIGWSAVLAGGEVVTGHFVWVPSATLAAAMLFIVIGPAILAYRFWGEGVKRAGPATAGFFANLMPLFTALLSIPILGEMPQLYHALAFALIVGGIVVSSRR
ncbi:MULTISPECIES: DMT family transporter [Comamonas]|jgi:drug/metabolite transporter (DMT)-like permease|uniref:DMT family transporter n=1 Tax=Comamonas avium TaxID=2762231 RepID=A0ABR8SBG7_9BURK|nr:MULTISPECIES: DMT family transporter [Comamonas]MBD7960826.1 DMT family transporter [Comamonas avium]